MSDLGSAALTTEVDLSGLEQGLGEAEQQTQSRLGSMAEGLKGSLGLAFAGIGVALAGALAGAGVAAVDIAAQFRDAQGQMQAQLGVTAEEAQQLGDVARDVFGNNFGSSVEDVGQSIIEVRQQMKGLSDDELAGATEAALALRDAFGFEVTESTNAANLLMEKFGLTSQQAFDFITKGQQAGLNTSGDFLETITEYGNLMSDNGFTAEQFFSVMETGLQSGVLGTDKVADAFKEFGIITQEMSEEVWGPDGVLRNSLRMSDEEINRLFNGLQDGSVTIADFYGAVQPKLAAMENDVYRNTAGVALFGTMWEDMGADAMLSLDLTATSMADMAGATDSLNAQYTSLGGVWEGVTRGFLLAIEPLGIALLDLANVAMPYLLAGAEQLRAGIEVAIGFIGPFIQGVVSFVAGLLAGEGAASLGAWGAAFQQAQGVIQGVMDAIMGIVGPILATLSAFWSQHGGEIVAFAQQAWDQIAAIVGGVLAILQATVIPILTGIGQFIGQHSDDILALLSAAWANIQTVISTVLAVVQGIINTVLAVIRGDWSGAWEAIKSIVSTVISAVQSIISTTLGAIQTIWSNNQDAILGKAREIWEGVKGAVASGIQGALDTVTGLAGRFVDAGRALIDNLRDGVMGQIDKLISDAKGALKKLTDLLPGSEPKDPTSPLAGLGLRGVALAENFLEPALERLASYNLRPALAGIAGQLDAAMGGELAGASASAQADVSVRVNEGGLRGLIDVQVDRRLNATGRDAATRRRTGG